MNSFAGEPPIEEWFMEKIIEAIETKVCVGLLIIVLFSLIYYTTLVHSRHMIK